MAVIVLGALAFVFLGGGRSSPGVVLLNLDRAFRDSGRAAALTETMKIEQAALSSKLGGLRADLENMISTKKKEFGDSPNEQQQKDLKRLDEELVVKIRQATEKNQQQLQQFVGESITQFRQEVKPIAEKVAAKHNASIVLNLTTEQIISFNYSSDITDEVVAALQKEVKSPVSGN